MKHLRDALCLLPVVLLLTLTPRLVAFVPAQLSVRPPLPPPSRGSSAAVDAPRSATSTSVMGLTGIMFLAAAAAAARGRRVAMHSQGQGGRFNVGQFYMPKLKGAKKMAVLRKRKNYGSYRARSVPRRYPLYDKLEELDETTPWYTVLSEPEEPLEPVFDVPLLERYPWAGSLEKVPLAKQEMESNTETGLEPYFGSFTRQNLPPLGRNQRYICRRGWPTYNYPPWINRPLIGTGLKVDGSMRFKKDRRPKRWQLPKSERARLREQEAKMEQAKDEVLEEMDVEDEDDLDDLLGTADD